MMNCDIRDRQGREEKEMLSSGSVKSALASFFDPDSFVAAWKWNLNRHFGMGAGLIPQICIHCFAWSPLCLILAAKQQNREQTKKCLFTAPMNQKCKEFGFGWKNVADGK